MSTSFPSATNVYVPGFSADTTGKLIVEYSRDPKTLPVNQIASIVPVDVPTGYYMRLKPEAQGRLLNSPQSYVWADGSPRPIQVENMQDFDYVQYFAQRYTRTHPLGYLTSQFASWDVEKSQANVLANQIMTMRAAYAYSVLSTSGNYISTHVDTATNWGGGVWSSATSTNRYIQKTLVAMYKRILKSSLGAVKLSDMVVVMGPDVADAAARSAEIADYVGGSPYSGKFLEFEAWQNQTQAFGLPPTLYGFKVLVDSSVSSTSAVGATATTGFIPGTSSVYMIARPGSLVSSAGGANFSSLAFFTVKNWEMKTETIDQPIDARKVLSVTDMWDCKMVAREASAAATSVP